MKVHRTEFVDISHQQTFDDDLEPLAALTAQVARVSKLLRRWEQDYTTLNAFRLARRRERSPVEFLSDLHDYLEQGHAPQHFGVEAQLGPTQPSRKTWLRRILSAF